VEQAETKTVTTEKQVTKDENDVEMEEDTGSRPKDRK
jgi:hypothetical protein